MELIRQVSNNGVRAAKGLLGVVRQNPSGAPHMPLHDLPIRERREDALARSLDEIRKGDDDFRAYIKAFTEIKHLEAAGLDTPDVSDLDVESRGVKSWYDTFRYKLRLLSGEYRAEGINPGDDRLLNDIGQESAAMYLSMSYVLPDAMYRGWGVRTYDEANAISIDEENRPEALTLVRAWMLGSALNRSGHQPRVTTVYSNNGGYHFGNAFFVTDLSLTELLTGTKPDKLPNAEQKQKEQMLLTSGLEPGVEEYRLMLSILRETWAPGGNVVPTIEN